MWEKIREPISFKINFKLLTRLNDAIQAIDRDRSSFIREAIEEKLDAMDRSRFETPPIADPYYGQYREFNIGERRIAVSITPWRNDPCIIFHILDDRGNTFSILDFEKYKDHPVVSAYLELCKTDRYYSWEAEGFIKFCRDHGLQPGEIKPRFDPVHEKIASILLYRSCKYDQFPPKIARYRNYIQDVLDIIRANGASSETQENLLSRCCRDFVEWEEQPEASEIKALLIKMGGSL